MKKNQFMLMLAERLQIKEPEITDETRFDSFSEWDSWAKLEVMTYVDETFNITLSSDDLTEIETFGDLNKKIGSENLTD